MHFSKRSSNDLNDLLGAIMLQSYSFCCYIQDIDTNLDGLSKRILIKMYILTNIFSCF